MEHGEEDGKVGGKSEKGGSKNGTGLSKLAANIGSWIKRKKPIITSRLGLFKTQM